MFRLIIYSDWKINFIKCTVKKEWIEDLAVKYALDILNNEDLINLLTENIYEMQGEENPRLPRLKQQLDETSKGIENLVNAIEKGIIFDSTKERLEKLENDKKELEIIILQEQIKKPYLTKEQIRFGIEKFKKLDISQQEGKQRLIDSFINSIYLYDDKIIFTFNYKDGTRTVNLNEIESVKGSDLKCQSAPKNNLTFRYGCFCL